MESKYLMLDVETNGLSSLKDDLLSFTFYKPDDNIFYDRFLPLELNKDVKTTQFNGITKELLEVQSPVDQKEFDDLFNEFELGKRVILHYGDLDEPFFRNYLKRHKIKGWENLKFYNFKKDVIGSSFSGGKITKDNLCRVYKIPGIENIHSSKNDCFLQWELFSKMGGNKLLVSNGKVYELNEEYKIPASYLFYYPNFKFIREKLPKIYCELVPIKEFLITNKKIKKFQNNITGITVEHIINSMLNVKKINNQKFLNENIKKLNYIGKIDNLFYIEIALNNDGTISALDPLYKDFINDINDVALELKAELEPLIDYIKSGIFKGNEILSQELVVNKNIFAICDLSNDGAVLEIKTNLPDMEKVGGQLYYQSNGRPCYLLYCKWYCKGGVKFVINKVEFIQDCSYTGKIGGFTTKSKESARRWAQQEWRLSKKQY